MKKFLSMAALALVGATFTGCSNEDDSIIDTTQQPEVIKSNVVTMTTTVGLDGAAATRALTSTGVKTFAKDDKIAVVYEKNDGTMAKVESTALTKDDISADGKSATFTVTLSDAKASGTVKYIYPAAMAGATDVDYTKLNSQDGTLASLAANLDLAVYDGNLTSEAKLPASATLENKLAILAVTLKNETGTSDITSSTTKLTVSDGTNTYNVTREAAAGPIYVAIRPTSDATIDITATSGGKGYYKTLTTTKSYAASNGYPVSWRMTQGANLSLLTAAYTAQNGDKLTGELGENVKISIADGATVTLNNVTINGTNDSNYDWAGITCLGDATIILSGTNTVKGFYGDYPGIQAAAGKTLIINGTGSLTASSYGWGAGIGGGSGSGAACGNIEIQGGKITATSGEYGAGIGGGNNSSWGDITISGGTVTATGGYRGAGIGGGRKSSIGSVSCGNITISGGTVTATGGEEAAGIGGGRGYNSGTKSSCGTITITTGVTKVTATKGSDAPNSIGAGNLGTCGTVTIEAGANVTQN